MIWTLLMRHRAEQLNLQNDPGFNIELDLGFDLSCFDTTFSDTEHSNLMSPRTLASSQTSYLDEEHGLGAPEFPEASSSHGAAAGFDFDAGDLNGPLFSDRPSRPPSDQAQPPEAALIEDEFFDIHEDGSLVLRQVSNQPASDKTDDGDNLALQGQIEEFDLGLDIGDDIEEQPVSFQDQDTLRLTRTGSFGRKCSR